MIFSLVLTCNFNVKRRFCLLHSCETSSTTMRNARHAWLVGVVFWAGNLPRHQRWGSRVVSGLHTQRPRQGQDNCPFGFPDNPSTRRRSPHRTHPSIPNRQGRAAASKAAPVRLAVGEACRLNPIALKVSTRTRTPPNRNGPLSSYSFFLLKKLTYSILSWA
jgi:hypothetical protein